MDGCGRVAVPSDTANVWMNEMELVRLFGVIAPTLRAAIRAVYKSGVLKPCEVERRIRLPNGYYSEAYRLTPGVWAREKGHSSKKATDFAIACGVSVKGRKAYHTPMLNGLCAAPSGKSISKPAKVTAGEVLWFSAKKEDALKQREKTLKK